MSVYSDLSVFFTSNSIFKVTLHKFSSDLLHVTTQSLCAGRRSAQDTQQQRCSDSGALMWPFCSPHSDTVSMQAREGFVVVVTHSYVCLYNQLDQRCILVFIVGFKSLIELPALKGTVTVQKDHDCCTKLLTDGNILIPGKCPQCGHANPCWSLQLLKHDSVNNEWNWEGIVFVRLWKNMARAVQSCKDGSGAAVPGAWFLMVPGGSWSHDARLSSSKRKVWSLKFPESSRSTADGSASCTHYMHRLQL